MSLLEYINKNYKPEKIPTYEEYLKDLYDYNKNGVIDGYNAKTGVSEVKLYKRALAARNDSANYAQYEKQVQTLIASNNNQKKMLIAEYNESASLDGNKNATSIYDVDTTGDTISERQTTQQTKKISILFAIICFFALIFKNKKNG